MEPDKEFRLMNERILGFFRELGRILPLVFKNPKQAQRRLSRIKRQTWIHLHRGIEIGRGGRKP